MEVTVRELRLGRRLRAVGRKDHEGPAFAKEILAFIVRHMPGQRKRLRMEHVAAGTVT
jgi:hypothetical protein